LIGRESQRTQNKNTPKASDYPTKKQLLNTNNSFEVVESHTYIEDDQSKNKLSHDSLNSIENHLMDIAKTKKECIENIDFCDKKNLQKFMNLEIKIEDLSSSDRTFENLIKQKDDYAQLVDTLLNENSKLMSKIDKSTSIRANQKSNLDDRNKSSVQFNNQEILTKDF